MDVSASKRSPNEGAILLLIAMVGLIVLLATNLPWQLDDYDQAKQAFTSFEMVEQGHWFYQHTPNEKIATKPPLVGWVSAGTFKGLRSWGLAGGVAFLAPAGLLRGGVGRAGGPAP